MHGCDVPPKCEALAQAAAAQFGADADKFQLWSTVVVTANPSPGNYQLDHY